MIARLATDADLPALEALSKRVWSQLGQSYVWWKDLKLSDQPTGFRVAVLLDGRTMVAALGTRPMEVEEQSGFKIVLFVVDQSLSDKVTLLDELVVFCCNIAASEGRYTIWSRPIDATKPLYGVGAGMDIRDDLAESPQLGDVRDISQVILDRNAWRISP
jgi:hypothetical protein